jgi:hypothetical protein
VAGSSGAETTSAPNRRGGTQKAAILYTPVETAKVTGVDPITYLAAAATRAKRESAVLLPADFAAAA